jgi:hypothetical protein
MMMVAGEAGCAAVGYPSLGPKSHLTELDLLAQDVIGRCCGWEMQWRVVVAAFALGMGVVGLHPEFHFQGVLVSSVVP